MAPGSRVPSCGEEFLHACRSSVSGEYCAHRYEFGLSPGRYSVKVIVPRVEAVHIRRADRQRRFHCSRACLYDGCATLVWRGQLVRCDGCTGDSPWILGINDANEVRSIDFLTMRRWQVRDRLCARLGREFAPTWIIPRATSVRKRVALDGGALPPIVVLDDLAPTTRWTTPRAHPRQWRSENR